MSSGEIPRSMSIGTKIVDRMAHFDVADVIKRFKKPVKMMMPKSEMVEGMPRSFKN